ncbi:MAG: NADPH:quinone reductase, partial [Pirellulales bacterium]|nr:NADPH:quinone reductase [Pirellulales bacterium]
MKAVWYEQLGAAADVLHYGDMPQPEPGPGEVRVKLAVSGVNPIDVKRRLGGRGPLSAPRVVPHFDGAGTIDAVGQGVTDTRIGERVWVYQAQWQRDFGTAAEWVTLPTEFAVALPDSTSFDEGACLGIPALTAHRCVFTDGDVQGQTVLVTGGAGAVGRYAVQFAKLGGARTVATVSNDEKAELATSAGADFVINYRADDVNKSIQQITSNQGVDRIVEVEFGGNLATSVDVLAPGGVIAAYASQAAPEPAIPFYTLMYKSITLRLVITFGMPAEAKQRAVTDISRWLQNGKLSHHLGPQFPLAETVAAHEAIERGTSGKVLLAL